MGKTREIDFDEEYFQRTVLRRAEKLADADVKQKFGNDVDSDENHVEGYWTQQRDEHYHTMMRSSAQDADIPLHVETKKTADAEAYRYRVREDVNPGDINLKTDNAVEMYFDVAKTTVEKSAGLEVEGYFRSPSEAIAWSMSRRSSCVPEKVTENMESEEPESTEDTEGTGETIQAREIDDDEYEMDLKNLMEEYGMTPAYLAGALGKRPETIGKWMVSGVPTTMQNKVINVFRESLE